MNILFLNGGRRCELLDAFRRSLRKIGGGLICVSDISEYAPALYKADKAVLLPPGNDSKFGDALIGFCLENRIDLLIPTIDPDLERLDALRERLAKSCPSMRLLLSPSSTIRIARNKRLSKELFSKLGAEVPEYAAPDATQNSFPLFVKPPDGSASNGILKVDNPEELRQALKQRPDLMVEKYVDGSEYTVDVLCDFEGRALCAVPRLRMKVRGGEVTQGMVELNPELIALSKRLAEAFQSTGPVTLQFRSPSPGRFVAMELNARMGGGLPLSIAAGADWPAAILDLCAGKTPDTSFKIHDRAIMTRYDSSVFIAGDAANSLTLSLARNTAPAASPTPLSGIRALIFDLDDTLYPERDFVFSAYRTVAEKVWQDFRVEIEAELRKLFLAGRRGDLFSAALREKKIVFDEDYVLGLVAAYRSHTPQLSPYTDIAIIPELRSQGFKTGLLTDGWAKVQSAKIKALGIEGLFDAIILSDELGGPEMWKPSPAPFEAILEKLKAKASEAVYIGDNPRKDFLGAKRCGMATLRLRRPGTEHEMEEPDTKEKAPSGEISSLSELPALLQ